MLKNVTFPKDMWSNQSVRFFSFILFLLLCWYMGRLFQVDFNYVRTMLSEFPILLSGLIFIVLYVVLTFFIWVGPKDFFRISGAVIFGPYISTLFIWTAEILNACLLFHLSRKLGRGFVEEKFKVSKDRLDRVQERTSIFGALIFRANPLIPFRFMDLAYGLTRIRLRKYILAVALGSPLRILWLQLILAKVGINLFTDPQLVVKYLGKQPGIAFFSFSYLFVVCLLTLVYGVFRIQKRGKERRRATSPAPNPK